MSAFAARNVILKDGTTAIIRSASAKDATSTVEILRGVVAEGPYTLSQPDEFRRTPASERRLIEGHKQTAGKVYLVAEVDGWVVGYLNFSNGSLKRTAHSGTLSLFVRRPWRGLGIGRALLQALLDWAAAEPIIEKVTLAVFSNNQRAIALYEEMGFQVEGRCPRDMKFADEQYVDSVLMYRFVDGERK